MAAVTVAPIANSTVLTAALRSLFFSSRRRHTRFDCDWSSDVCSSDLYDAPTVSPADEDRVAEAPRVEDNSFTGLTIGIESVDIPAASGLLARLRGLATRSCELHWVTTEGVCHSLEVKLGQAQASLERGNATAARAQLQAFLNELDAQHGPEPGKHVTDNGFWLLKINVEY